MSILDAHLKEIDLEHNNGLSSIGNHAAQQHHAAYQKFYSLLQRTKPQRILEIGTALGGFTAVLDLATKELGLNTKIRSYDISDRSWYDELRSNGVDVFVLNIFHNNYTSIDKDIIDFIQKDGVTLILCDGGYKIGEFNILSSYIKHNDIIMAHDYAPNREYFEEHMKNKIWNWHEIQDSDIIESCQKYGLVPYMREEFLNVAWACFKKELETL
jgi:23S rRNA U2552 (ribose-2'-O)-methylase RlmE/FtsJ